MKNYIKKDKFGIPSGVGSGQKIIPIKNIYYNLISVGIVESIQKLFIITKFDITSAVGSESENI